MYLMWLQRSGGPDVRRCMVGAEGRDARVRNIRRGRVLRVQGQNEGSKRQWDLQVEREQPQ